MVPGVLVELAGDTVPLSGSHVMVTLEALTVNVRDALPLPDLGSDST